MNIIRLVEKMLIRFFLLLALIPLQSCSNTLIGEKLENSFVISESPNMLEKTSKEKVENKFTDIKVIKSTEKDDMEKNVNVQKKIKKINLIANKDRPSQKSTNSIKKVIFKPQPYRIILRLSGANPSAPAETVTEALIKAGVEFEVEKIERFNEKKLLKDSSLKR